MLLMAALACAGMASAQDDEPDLSFLEYLGSWQEGDEDWLVIAAQLEEEPEDKDEASAKDEETDETDQN